MNNRVNNKPEVNGRAERYALEVVPRSLQQLIDLINWPCSLRPVVAIH